MDTETQNTSVNPEEQTPVQKEIEKEVRQAETQQTAPSGPSAGSYTPRGPRKNTRKVVKRERVKPEFDHKIINIRRVTRVVAGGRRFSFSVALVAGNRKGSVGVGTGKAGDTALAIEKAMRSAKKHMINLSLTKNLSIPYEVSAKYCSARIFIAPAPGRGITAGSSVRTVVDLGGIKDVRGKILSGSKNKLNNAQAAIKALSAFATRS